ncbi:MAG: hypothetical protein FJY82_07080 [Candidatus Aminicenantes bacterium]|nr:hypothetical protein [Candidatus Aminicenantes bacterium]
MERKKRGGWKGWAFGLSLAVSAGPLLGQGRVDFELFGLKPLPLGGLASTVHHFNAYGKSWDSFQRVVFDKASSPLGFGGGATYWLNGRFGLRLRLRTWRQEQASRDNEVRVEYSYTPWYPIPSPMPVVVSYELKSQAVPRFAFRVGALSLGGVCRAALGRGRLDFSGGLTLYQAWGEIANLYLKRVIPSSHMTFLSAEVAFTKRFDAWGAGGHFGLDFALRLGPGVEGWAGVEVLLGGGRIPGSFVSSIESLGEPVLAVVLKGTDEVRDYIRAGEMKLNPSRLAFELGLRFRAIAPRGPSSMKPTFSLAFIPGMSRMNPDFKFTRTVQTSDEQGRRLEQEVEGFNRRLVWSPGLALDLRASPRWAVELGGVRLRNTLDVDSGVIYLLQDSGARSREKSQRPSCRAAVDEINLSAVRFFPVRGAELLAAAGVCLARLSLSWEEVYFLYWRRPLTDDFVSFSGLFSAVGGRWTAGARTGLGFLFPLASFFEFRLRADWHFYPAAALRWEVKDVVLDENVYGPGTDRTLRPDELQPEVGPASLAFNPSRFQLTCGLAVKFR